MIEEMRYKELQLSCYSTLEALVTSNSITKNMALKIAGSGLEYQHIKKIIERNGLDGPTAVFKAKTTSGVRVTSQKKLL